MATTGATSGPNPISSATGDMTKKLGGSDTLDKDSFLLLLVTQFKYQDPLNPMEDKEFIAQLAQFTALEQQMQTNEQMENLVGLQTQQQMISAVSYIGKEVSARGYGVAVVNGEASLIQYANAEEMTKGYANIFDANGSLINTVDLKAGSPGIHDFVWDCKTTSGGTVSDGVYTVKIAGENAAGEKIMVDMSVTGKVTGVSQADGEQILTLSDGRMVALSYVRQVQDSAAVGGTNSWSTSVKDGDAAPLWYRLPRDAESIEVTIRNAANKVVAVETMEETKAGNHSFKWDGKLDDDTVAPDGDYLLSFKALDAAKKEIILDKM